MSTPRRSREAKKTKLLLDADVIIHFFKAGKLLNLPTIFPEYNYVLLDLVWEEIKSTSIGNSLKMLINSCHITLLEFPTDNDAIDNEFEHLKFEGRGTGESACMAYAMHNKEDIIASSNLKDLLPYCDKNRIPYLTTIDFLCKALLTGLYTETDCDDFIREVLVKGSNLPIKRMQHYNCSERKILKYR